MKALTKVLGVSENRNSGRLIKKATTCFLILLIGFSSLSALSFMVTNVHAAPIGTWTTEAALPDGRADLPGVVYNNMLYVFGGYQIAGGGGRPEVYAYNPSTNSWTQKTSMTYARWGSAAALYGGIAYVFGGDDGANENKVEAYNFASDTWATKNNLPNNLAGQGQMAVTVGPLIYIFSTTFAYSYNPSTDSYIQLASNPISTRWGTCAYVNVAGENRIYIMGGADDSTGQSLNTVLYYRPTFNDWTFAGNTPYYGYGTLRDNPVINGLIYFGFGHDQLVFFTYLFSYDPNTDTWSSPLPQATYPRDGLACGVINGKLYAVGGRNSVDFPILGLDYNEQFDPGNALTASISPLQVRMDLGQSQTFTSIVSGGTTPYSYQWYLNDTAVQGATSSNWIFKPTSAGHYRVYLTVTDSLNVEAQSNTVSDILVYPTLTTSISPTSVNLTIGSSQTFTSTVSGGISPYTYQWYYTNGTAITGATNPTLIFKANATGTYNIYLNVTDSLNAKTQSNTATITVNLSLVVTVSPTKVVLYFGQSQTFSSSVSGGFPGYSYQWYLNGTAVSGATNPTWTFTPKTNGNYNVYLNVTDSQNNKAQSNTITDINVYSVNLLLTAEPNQTTHTKHQPVTLTVNVFNQLNPTLQSTLTLTVTGPNGYYFYDFQPINVAANRVGEYSFDWVAPNIAGTYVVETSLAPSLLTAYDTSRLVVS